MTVHFLLFLDDQSGDQVVPARISRTDVVLPDYFERLRSSHAVRTKVGARVVGKGAEKLGTEPVPSIVADGSVFSFQNRRGGFSALDPSLMVLPT